MVSKKEEVEESCKQEGRRKDTQTEEGRSKRNEKNEEFKKE